MVYVLWVFSLIICCALVTADLRTDLSDFRKLVPRRRIGYIAARYYIFDPRFRQATDFIRSEEFLKTWQEIRASPEVTDLIDYVTEHGSGYDVSSLVDRLSNRLRSYQVSRVVPVEMMLNRDLTTFLDEMLQSLPRAKIYSLISRKLRENGAFAQLYKALRAKEFKPLVEKARNSSDLKEHWTRLKKKHIDINELTRIMYELISWGPQIS